MNGMLRSRTEDDPSDRSWSQQARETRSHVSSARRRRVVTFAATAAVTLVSALAPIPAAAYTPTMTVDRIAGSDRYATAAAISQQFAAPVSAVYVATGQNFPDALSAAPAAAAAGGPLLLTSPTALPASVRSEIQRLQPQLVVVGGTGAVSAAVYAELATLAPSIRRDAGSNRYETSRIVTERAFHAGAVVAPFLATGANFPDALSASAAAGASDDPVILVNGSASGLDAPTLSLLSRYQIERLYIAGGTGVVSIGVENSAKTAYGSGNVERIAGTDRYQTSSAIMQRFAPTSARTFVAVGTGFADALAGATLAGSTGVPLVVSRSTCVPAATLDAIASVGVTRLTLLGGTGALGRGVMAGTKCLDAPPFSGNGDKRVNVDIAAGTYFTYGGDACYWERLKSFDGSFSSIIANGFGSGPWIVTIATTDVGFSTQDCGAWTPVQNAPALSAPYAEGSSAVMLQFDPGTYRNANTAGNCYWAKLRGFSGELHDIIDNDFVASPGQIIVTIESSVEGFESSGCGAWTRVS